MNSFNRFLTIVVLGSSLMLSSAAANPPILTGTVDVKHGLTSIALDDAFSSILTNHAVVLRKIIPGQIVPGRQLLRIPISGGAIDLDTAEGEVTHRGGFALKTDTVKVSLTDFVLSTPAATDTTTLPSLSCLVTVNGDLSGRVNLFQVDLSGVAAPLSLPPNKKVMFKTLNLTLTADGAAALNTAFNTTEFLADSVAGTLTVTALTARGTL